MYYPYIDKYEFFENLPIYIFITIIVIIISIFVTIKLSFPFWNLQPVYHTYDFWRILYREPFYIHKRFVSKNINKFTQLNRVETHNYLDMIHKDKELMVDLLQCYFTHEDSIFVFNVENLDAYFTGHTINSYISFYKLGTDKVGCISSRSCNLDFKQYNKQFPIYFIDFLCLKRGDNQTHDLRTLMQTHIYQTQQCSQMNAFIFKREKDLLSGIVPFVRFKTSFYTIPIIKESILPQNWYVFEIQKTNIHIFFDFLKENRFSTSVITTNLVELIEKGTIHIYCLRHTEIYSVYIFRDTRTNYDNLGSVLQLVGSVQKTSSQLFIQGFINSIFKIIKKTPIYKILTIDSISDNYALMNLFSNIQNFQSAYYLYNIVCQTQNDTDVFLLV